ncbi:MAG: hypothetical protein QNJ97_01960 [Myxococcota bacterium]|nr:hypothetical protein [Myxococcota bacterium]
MSILRKVGLLALFVVVWFNTGKVFGQTPGPPVRVAIDASLDENGKILAGNVRISITNTSREAIASVPMMLYPNRFTKVDPALGDRMVRWIYPAGESPGKMDIKNPRWNGIALSEDHIRPHQPSTSARGSKDNVCVRIALPQPLAPGDIGILELDFSVFIPERRGRFGRWRGVVSLGGGWFPRPLSDLSGRDTTLPPDTIAAEVRLALPAGRGAVLCDRVFPLEKHPRRIEATGLVIDALALVVMDRMEIDVHPFDWGKVVHVHQSLRAKPPTWQDTRGGNGGLPQGLPDLGEVDTTGRIFEVVGNTARLVRDLSPHIALPQQLVLVDIPAWDRLVQPGTGAILVSDRIFQVIPIEAGLRFHDLALVRSIGFELLRSTIARIEPLPRRFVTLDMVGSFVADIYSTEVHKRHRSVKDIVGFASFLPIIDNLLYAPQVPFREVYTRSIEDPDLLRDEPWRATNDLPYGKRILGKIEDRLGSRQTAALMTDLLQLKRPFDVGLKLALGSNAAAFEKQWYGTYPSVNYRIGEIQDIQKPDGKVLHRVAVIREGDAVWEPVTVRIKDQAGHVQDIMWDGNGPTGTVEWISNAPVDTVRLDPEGRLVESAALTEDHPLADNLNQLPWRPPLLTHLLFFGDLLYGDPYIQAGVTLRKRYDLTNALILSGAHTPRSYGGSFGYLRFFGPKRTLNARTMYIGPVFGVRHFRTVAGQDPGVPESTRFTATAGSLKLLFGRDNRSYFFDPRSGSKLSARVGYSLGRDDRGGNVQVGEVSVNQVWLYSPAIRHTFAGQVGAMGVVGKPAATQLATLSVRHILRGFDIDETYGRIGLYAVFEYRHTLADGAHIKAPAFSWFDRFQGVLFAGGGTISAADGYAGLFSKDRIYSEIGYGLRIHLLSMGVQQYIIALDLAVPVTPFTRKMERIQEDGSTVDETRDRFKIKFGILQTF